MTRSVYTLCGFQNINPVGFCVVCAFCGGLQAKEIQVQEPLPDKLQFILLLLHIPDEPY